MEMIYEALCWIVSLGLLTRYWVGDDTLRELNQLSRLLELLYSIETPCYSIFSLILIFQSIFYPLLHFLISSLLPLQLLLFFLYIQYAKPSCPRIQSTRRLSLSWARGRHGEWERVSCKDTCLSTGWQARTKVQRGPWRWKTQSVVSCGHGSGTTGHVSKLSLLRYSECAIATHFYTFWAVYQTCSSMSGWWVDIL